MTDFYSIQEASAFLKVDYKVVYRLVKEGVIPSSRVGWQFRISEDELNAYLNAQRVKQAAESEGWRARGDAAVAIRDTEAQRASLPHASATNGAALPSTGAASHSPTGISKLKARQMEINFINRFDEKIGEVETVRHIVNDQLLRVDDWGPLRTQTEDREALMQALNTAFLDKRTLATTPRNITVRYTVPAKPLLVVEACVLCHLDALLNAGVDDAPASLEDLMIEIDRLEDEQRRTRAACVSGLASPTGWESDAAAFIEGSQRGAVYRNPAIRIVLVDLRSETVHFDANDGSAAGYAALFALATDRENTAGLRDLLRTELVERTGLIINEFARSLEVGEIPLLEAARLLVEEGGYQLIPDRTSGWILVKR